MKQTILFTIAGVLLCASGLAQVNSGSNGSDGAFNPTTDIVINMADHPTGVYHYTSVDIPTNVTVTFIPNANNTPVVWLVQSNCTIEGRVSVNGLDGNYSLISSFQGGMGGPGGFAGGNAGRDDHEDPGSGIGPGGGKVAAGHPDWYGGNASFGTVGSVTNGAHLAGDTYGNEVLLPLIGGSGGGGGGSQSWYVSGARFSGGGGGGAILIAVSGNLLIEVSGKIEANGGAGGYYGGGPYGSYGGGGSGGGIRLIATRLEGRGLLSASGGYGSGSWTQGGGRGRIRLESYFDDFTGSTVGVTTRGFTGIIIMPTNELPQLSITSIGGVPVSVSPSGQLATPDAVLSAQQNNAIPITVHCSNIPLNSPITVTVKPANGPAVSATGLNNSGTLASSTATVSTVIPRGGGLIYATAATSN